jgi:hypothetical protein
VNKLKPTSILCSKRPILSPIIKIEGIFNKIADILAELYNILQNLANDCGDLWSKTEFQSNKQYLTKSASTYNQFHPI